MKALKVVALVGLTLVVGLVTGWEGWKGVRQC